MTRPRTGFRARLPTPRLRQVDFSRGTRRHYAPENIFIDYPTLWKFAPSRHRRRYGWKRRVGLRLDKERGPVIRWRDDFLIIAPSSPRPPGACWRRAACACTRKSVIRRYARSNDSISRAYGASIPGLWQMKQHVTRMHIH